MRHRKSGIKLNRTTSHRQAMFRNMVTSLLKHERIRTTDTKAKELRRWVDHVITLAKRGDLHARRQAMAIVREKAVVHKIFAEAGEKFANINGGYTRIVKLGRRPGDAAPLSLIELVSAGNVVKKEKKKTKPVTKAEAVAEKTASTEKAESVEVEAAPTVETEPDNTEIESEASGEADGAMDLKAEAAEVGEVRDSTSAESGEEIAPGEDSPKKD